MYKIGIEIDGGYYHEDRLEKDKQKSDLLTKKGIKLFRLRNQDLPQIDDFDIL